MTKFPSPKPRKWPLNQRINLNFEPKIVPLNKTEENLSAQKYPLNPAQTFMGGS
jgi:hypothetical protein